MAHLSLSRQYRPQQFGDVHGQDHVTRTLQNAIRLGRTAQAYLFCGPRGVGKTTVARILAKALNCDRGPTSEPCGECDGCRRISEGSSLCVIEIDAASHRSIDDIRSLREDVQFAPTDGRYKVYILDEAHQITGPAFEAFLKTLEEPPAHVVFVLATTEPHKIPATILSRCQRFDFRRVGVEDIVTRLKEVAGTEGLQVEEAAYHAVARAADGGLRDALSILDQITAYSGEAVTANDVAAVLGSLESEVRFELGEALATRDATAGLAWLGRLLDLGRDARQLVAEILEHLRLLLLARLNCAPEELLALAEDVRERLVVQAALFEPDRLMQILEAWAECDKQLRWHPQPRILLEVTLLDLLVGAPGARRAAPPPQPGYDRAPEPRPEPRREAAPDPRREPAPEPREERSAPPPEEPPRPKPAPPPRPEETAESPLGADEPLTVEAVRERQDRFLALMAEGWPPLMANLVNGHVLRVEGTDIVYGFEGWEASLNLCLQPERRKIIQETWSKVLGRPVQFRGELVQREAAAASTEATDETVPDLGQAVSLAKETFPGSREIDG